MILTQTILKKLKDDRYCPQRIKQVYIDRTVRDIPSEAMTKGMFFEYITLGNPNYDGEIIDDLPRKKGGDKTTDQLRIEAQSAKFKKEVMPLYNIEITDKGSEFSIPYKTELGELTLRIRADFVGAMVYKEETYPLIGDLKLTADIYSTFGDFSWGYPANMDHTQGLLYTWVFTEVMRQSGEKFSKDPIFIYFVFDYKPVPEYKLIHVAPSKMRYNEIKEMIRSVQEKILAYDATSWPYRPKASECFSCPLVKTCPAANRKPEIEIV